MLKTILVPTDGSPLAERALPYATTLASKVDGRVVLVRAALAHPQIGMDELAAQLMATQQAEYDVAVTAEQLERDGIPVERAVYYDEAAAAITDPTQRRKAGLVVMSTHGRPGLGRWIYGSVADRVLRQTDVPVLLVPPGCERTWSDNRKPRILVPLDGSDLAEEALGPADELAEALGAELLL